MRFNHGDLFEELVAVALFLLFSSVAPPVSFRNWSVRSIISGVTHRDDRLYEPVFVDQTLVVYIIIYLACGGCGMP